MVLHKVAGVVGARIPERFSLEMRQIVALYIITHKAFNIIQDYLLDFFRHNPAAIIITSDHNGHIPLN